MIFISRKVFSIHFNFFFSSLKYLVFHLRFQMSPKYFPALLFEFQWEKLIMKETLLEEHLFKMGLGLFASSASHWPLTRDVRGYDSDCVSACVWETVCFGKWDRPEVKAVERAHSAQMKWLFCSRCSRCWVDVFYFYILGRPPVYILDWPASI